MGTMTEFYTPETGHNPCSNFSRHGFWLDDVWWDTNEHFYQASKTLNPEHREQIRLAESPGQAKRLGSKKGGLIVLRPDWAAVQIPVMRRGLAAKFLPDNEPGEFLLATGNDLLIEGNTWGDRFWGQVGGTGENWLGHLLTARRAELHWMRWLEEEDE
jgi:N-glycosidase YbiA